MGAFEEEFDEQDDELDFGDEDSDDDSLDEDEDDGFYDFSGATEGDR